MTSERLLTFENQTGTEKKTTNMETADNFFIAELEEQRDQLVSDNQKLQHKVDMH